MLWDCWRDSSCRCERAMNGMILQRAFYSFGINAVLYAGTYGIAVLAVMLTGNLIITLFAVAVLLVYEWVVRAIYYVFHAEFFEYFCSNSIETCAVSSPMWQYVQLSEWIRESAEAGMWIKAPWLSTIALGIVLALVFGLAAFSCYRLRPSEAAGKQWRFHAQKESLSFDYGTVYAWRCVYCRWYCRRWRIEGTGYFYYGGSECAGKCHYGSNL